MGCGMDREIKDKTQPEIVSLLVRAWETIDVLEMKLAMFQPVDADTREKYLSKISAMMEEKEKMDKRIRELEAEVAYRPELALRVGDGECVVVSPLDEIRCPACNLKLEFVEVVDAD